LECSARRRKERHIQVYGPSCLSTLLAPTAPEQEHQALPDPFFVEKVLDVVGLYLNPPDHAVVLSVDEKSQIQALNRTQPVLPMGLGYVEDMTHDYVRRGTTTLFAALDIATDTVLTECKPRHQHQEFLVGTQTAATDAAPDSSTGHHGSVPGFSTGIERLRRKWWSEPVRKQLHRGGHRNRCNHRRT
jgi:putative transposase